MREKFTSFPILILILLYPVERNRMGDLRHFYCIEMEISLSLSRSDLCNCSRPSILPPDSQEKIDGPSSFCRRQKNQAQQLPESEGDLARDTVVVVERRLRISVFRDLKAGGVPSRGT